MDGTPNNPDPKASRADASTPDAHAQLHLRLDRLEEAQLFADRANEELNSGLLNLARRLEETMSRLSRLEGRLTNLLESTGGLTGNDGQGQSSELDRDDDPTDRNHTES